MTSLFQLETSLPRFLKPHHSSSLGTQTWERQNSVLAFALAHARILATRRCLLIDAASFAGTEISRQHSDNVRVCISSIRDIIDRVHPMMGSGRLLPSFWLTIYTTMCAISTLFVYKIQRRTSKKSAATRSSSLPHLDDDLELASRFQKAEQIQEHLSKIAPPGSQAKRHHILLSKLRQRANRSSSPSGGKPQPAQQSQRSLDTSQPSQQEVIGPTLDMTLEQDQVAQPHYSNIGELPALMDNTSEGFTPEMLFDFEFPDALSWQWLDQLGSTPLLQDVDGKGLSGWRV